MKTRSGGNSLRRGSIAQRARLVSGLILFSFALTHLLNHALGLFSLEAMQTVQDWRLIVTRSLAGGIILAGAILIHMSLGIGKLAFRSTLRMPVWEATQIALGLAIPLLLIPHVVPMRFAYELFGTQTTYTNTLLTLWEGSASRQTALVLLVWVHGCIGVHFWLRLAPWYQRWFLVFFAIAVAVPLAALSGFMVAGDRLEAAKPTAPSSGYSSGYGSGYGSSYGSGDYGGSDYGGSDYGGGYGSSGGESQKTILGKWQEGLEYSFLGFLVLAASVFLARTLWRRRAARIEVNYLNGPTVFALPGATLLETSRMNGIPHASVCGGRGRCSTCRVRVHKGAQSLGPRSPIELAALGSIKAHAHDRLACQIRPRDAVSVVRIVPHNKGPIEALADNETLAHGEERDAAVFFMDMRSFTEISAGRLPYDVIFLLNQFFDATGEAIQANGGWIDKYIGDGLLAVFGRDTSPEEACRQALRAASDVNDALAALNQKIETAIGTRIRIGIGIHTGPLVIGRIGHADTAALTVVGRTVNVAARLEGLTKDHDVQLIVSGDVARLSGVNIDGRKTMALNVRGLPDPIEVVLFETASSDRQA